MTIRVRHLGNTCWRKKAKALGLSLAPGDVSPIGFSTGCILSGMDMKMSKSSFSFVTGWRPPRADGVLDTHLYFVDPVGGRDLYFRGHRNGWINNLELGPTGGTLTPISPPTYDGEEVPYNLLYRSDDGQDVCPFIFNIGSVSNGIEQDLNVEWKLPTGLPAYFQFYIGETCPKNWRVDPDDETTGIDPEHDIEGDQKLSSYWSDPNPPESVETNGDGLSDYAEALEYTDPCEWDTDGDYVRDGYEVNYEFDPMDSSDCDFAYDSEYDINWIDEYATADIEHGDEYYTGEKSSLAWSESYILESYSDLYRVTENRILLDKQISHIEYIKSNEAGFTSEDQFDSPVWQGMMASPILQFTYGVYTHPSCHDQYVRIYNPETQELDGTATYTYLDKANEYTKIIDGLINNEWGWEDTYSTQGNYEPANKPYNFGLSCARGVLQLSNILSYVEDINGDADSTNDIDTDGPLSSHNSGYYYGHVGAHATYFKNELQLKNEGDEGLPSYAVNRYIQTYPSDCIYWEYEDGDQTGRMDSEDLSHANIDIAFCIDYYNYDDTIYTDDHMKRFINTLVDVMWRGDQTNFEFSIGVDGSDHNSNDPQDPDYDNDHSAVDYSKDYLERYKDRAVWQWVTLGQFSQLSKSQDVLNIVKEGFAYGTINRCYRVQHTLAHLAAMSGGEQP